MPRPYTLPKARYEKSRARFRHKIEDVSEEDFKKALAALNGKFSVNRPVRKSGVKLKFKKWNESEFDVDET